ncbi:hypothetical protein BKA64DRAFT_747448 [Cadophora sp. MPI-SDFR-AT-0126]|nr:hypothetical protein BKA64DRAFT_747448 [Leotiomycetes sp. MPI-SDFR-AT-0126]
MVTTRFLAVLTLAIFPALSIAAAIPSPQIHTEADDGADIVRRFAATFASIGTLVKVSRFIVHPSYNEDTINKNVAIWQLSTPIPTSANISYTDLPDQRSDPMPGVSTTVSGWYIQYSTHLISSPLLSSFSPPSFSQARTSFPTSPNPKMASPQPAAPSPCPSPCPSPSSPSASSPCSLSRAPPATSAITDNIFRAAATGKDSCSSDSGRPITIT